MGIGAREPRNRPSARWRADSWSGRQIGSDSFSDASAQVASARCFMPIPNLAEMRAYLVIARGFRTNSEG
eukprot:10891757-Alexandrium_andersonii.AAC.1